MGCCSSKSSADALEVQNSSAAPSIGIPANLRGAGVEMHEGDPLTVTGKGAAMASAPIEQDAAYWEVKVLKAGSIRMGVSRKLNVKELEAGVSGGGDAPRSWTYADDNLNEGDVIGVAFSQSDLPNLAFTKNGKPRPTADVRKIGGMVYPVVSVNDGATVKVVFESEEFANSPPSRFSALMVAQSVL